MFVTPTLKGCLSANFPVAEYKRAEWLSTVAVYIANLICCDIVVFFEKKCIVEIEEQRVVIEFDHPISEAFSILQSVDPSVEAILHLKCALIYSVVDECNRREKISIREPVIIFVDRRQPHIEEIENLFAIKFAQMPFEVTP